MDHHKKPGTPGDILEHHGTKGMRWGVRKEEETGAGRNSKGLIVPKTTKAESKEIATRNATRKRQVAKTLAKNDAIRPGTPEFQRMIEQVTRTDHPQVLSEKGKIQAAPRAQKKGLSKNQKMLLAFGAVAAAGAGYYAYQHYTGGKMPNAIPRELLKEQQQVGKLEGMKIPAHWDVHGLKDRPLSTQRLGDLAGGDHNFNLLHPEKLVINTSRGYADILPKDGFSNPFAAEQHASVTRVLEQMRDKYPAIRNMNVEVVPYSHHPGFENGREGSHMCVLAMRAGEARVMYNDLMDAPSAATIRASRNFLPGLGKKDYVAMHEMGHLLAAAHGELPATAGFTGSGRGTSMLEKLGERGTWMKAEPLLHQKMFLKHGFTFKELSKISGYAATQPAEAMAELFGHYNHPEMRKRLTADQLTRAKAMFDEMGGLT